MASRIIPVAPFDLVIFGGTGDLAQRKILPGLLRRFRAGQMPPEARIIACARSNLDDAGYRASAAGAIAEFGGPEREEEKLVATFLERLHYVRVDVTGEEGWRGLATLMRPDTVRAFYCAVTPALFGPIAERLRKHGVADTASRIVVEKPFGHDLDSARDLNAALARHFDERQIYRIDHYLGKETVQNLMAVRFANMLFEPLWNNHYIDHIQITVAETVGVAGRGAYYDAAGAMRDMVQNHLMQLLCLTAMEPPARFNADAVRDEKLKVIRAISPVGPEDIVFGQYAAAPGSPSYREDVANPDSTTASFVALRCSVATWRWAGVPFYLRTGKRMKTRSSEIAVVFQELGHRIFDEDMTRHRNILSIRLQPNDGIDLQVTVKERGPGGMRLIDMPLDLTFADQVSDQGEAAVDAYERLIMDVIRGDQTLFMRGDEVEAAWAWTDPILAARNARGEPPKIYEQGSTGPDDALMLLHRDGRRWREIKG